MSKNSVLTPRQKFELQTALMTAKPGEYDGKTYEEVAAMQATRLQFPITAFNLKSAARVVGVQWKRPYAAGNNPLSLAWDRIKKIEAALAKAGIVVE